MFKELEDLVKFLVALFNALDSTYDGFDYTDLIDFIPALTLLPEAIKDIDQIDDALLKLTEEQRAKLIKLFEETEFTSERSEKLAEQGQRTALEIAKFFVMAQQARND